MIKYEKYGMAFASLALQKGRRPGAATGACPAEVVSGVRNAVWAFPGPGEYDSTATAGAAGIIGITGKG